MRTQSRFVPVGSGAPREAGLSVGQRPGLFIVDRAGIVRYAYLGNQQWEIPPNREVLQQLDKLQSRNPDGP